MEQVEFGCKIAKDASKWKTCVKFLDRPSKKCA
jgi:hypothetical protein